MNNVAKLEARVHWYRELKLQLEADIGQKKQIAQKSGAQLDSEQVG